MIAKCVALLAVVAQINGYVCNTNCATGCGVSGIVGSGLVGTPGLVGSAGIVGSAALTGATATSRNIVAKGKYPVALDNTGPVPDGRIPVSTSHVQAPLQEKPTVRLTARIPAPRTVAHSCTCYKQILRPRVHDQYITVPTVQRYIETSHTPIVENIHYEAIPVNAPSTYVNSGTLLSGQYASSIAQTVPVSAAVGTIPVSSSCGVSPCASSLPVASVPVRSIGLSGCGYQGYC